MASADSVTKVPKINMLISYQFMRRDRWVAEVTRRILPYANVLIDSGAFSDMTQAHRSMKLNTRHQAIDLRHYTEFCKTWGSSVWGYITLDVIGDAVKTKTNYERMLDAGLRPIPVFQNGESWDNVPFYMQHGRRIAIGGVAGNTAGNGDVYTAQRIQRLTDVSNGQALIHVLGWHKLPWVFDAPCRYYDSSSFVQGGRWGGWTHYEVGKGFQRFAALKPGESWESNPRSKKLVSLLLAYGVTPGELPMMQTRGYAADNNIFSAFAYLKFHLDSAAHNRSYFYAVCSRIHYINVLAPLAAMRADGTLDLPKAREILNVVRKYTPQRFADYFARTMTERTDLAGELPC